MEPDWDIILPILMLVLVATLLGVVWYFFVRGRRKPDANVSHTIVRSSRKVPGKEVKPAPRDLAPFAPSPPSAPRQDSNLGHTVIRSIRKPMKQAGQAPLSAGAHPEFLPPAAAQQDPNLGHTVIRSIRKPVKPAQPQGAGPEAASPFAGPRPGPAAPPPSALPGRAAFRPPPSASGSWMGAAIDKTVWRRGKVKIMLPPRERRLLKFIPIFLIVAVLLAIYLAWKMTPDSLRMGKRQGQDHVESKFRKEKLVPPPPMPPEFFVNTERPELLDANRDWSRLDPAFEQAILRILKRLETKGIPFTLLEGYRSPERQDRLALLGEHVTRARAFQSKHQYGLAVDLAPIRNGKLSINEREPGNMVAYEAMGREVVAEGLVWGGSWSKLKDFGHIEAPGGTR